jgi:hypothetical protein
LREESYEEDIESERTKALPLVYRADGSLFAKGGFRISKRFIEFYNLRYAEEEEKYYRDFADKESEEVVLVEENRVRIRLKEILQFAYMHGLRFVLLMDSQEFFSIPLSELNLEQDFIKEREVEKGCLMQIVFSDPSSFLPSSYRGFCRISGKRIFPRLMEGLREISGKETLPELKQ